MLQVQGRRAPGAGAVTKSFDGEFLRPGGFGPLEYPEPRTHLQERLEGQQISRLYYLDEAGPTGSYGMAFELADGSKLIVYAARDRYSRYTARLILRWLPVPLIVLPRYANAWSHGTDPLGCSPEELDELQRRLAGQIIHGVLVTTQPNAAGGEQFTLECGGGKLTLGATPIKQRIEGDQMLLADIIWDWSEPERRSST